MAEAQLTNQLTRIDSMTNVELRAELKKRGCSTSGNKKDLIAKLRGALEREYGPNSTAALSMTSMMDPIHSDGRRSETVVHQSPVGSYDGNRSYLNNSVASSSNYMTPHSGSPVVQLERAQIEEVPRTHNNSQQQHQSVGQYQSVYDTNANLNAHSSASPTIPVPQQLTVNTNERNQLQYSGNTYAAEQQSTPMTTRRSRASNDGTLNPSISPVVSTPSPEKRTRSRAKKVSVDSQPPETNNNVEQQPKPVENPVQEVEANQSVVAQIVEQPKEEALIVHNPSSNADNENNLEVNSFVSKSNEEDQRDVGEERGEREHSRSPSVGSSSAKSESVIKEIPLSGDRHRLSRSKSPKSRWHHSPSPREPEHQNNQMTPIDENSSASKTTIDGDEKHSDEQIEKPSDSTKPAEDAKIDANQHEEKKSDSVPEVQETQETPSNEKSKVHEQQPSEKDTSHQEQTTIARSQGSKPSSTSSSLMKGLNRSTSHRMNLSSDVLKTLIPDISLAPESVIETELETSNNDLNNVDPMDDSASQTVLETNAGSNNLLNESINNGESSEQKQRNRTVVIDLAVDSSSLNDDLVGNALETKKKNSTGTAPSRMASYESKILLDGKTNALMMDEPVRVKDVSAAVEPATRILYIVGLTRPFTPMQLKELLGRYGNLSEGEFWLDKIKSQCFVMYNTLEDAQSAREALDGCRWPSTNPKTLIVRFGRQEEFDFSKSHDLPPNEMPKDSSISFDDNQTTEKQLANNKQSRAARRSASPTVDARQNNKKSRQVTSGDVREWDLPKLQTDKEKSANERQVIDESAAKTKEPPAKGLDDYFRKTKAKPAIYWLSLTEEQAIERAQQKEKRKAEEEEKRKKGAEQNSRPPNNSKDSKSRSNNNGNSSSYPNNRRSISPKDKRKRVSTSSSPPRRDNKRH